MSDENERVNYSVNNPNPNSSLNSRTQAPTSLQSPPIIHKRPIAPAPSKNQQPSSLVSPTTTVPNTALFSELQGNSSESDPIDDEEDDESSLINENQDELIRLRILSNQEQRGQILQAFSNSQMDRYETFRRVGLPRTAVEKLTQKTLEGLGCTKSIGPTVCKIVAGTSKVFLGELVEAAVEVREEWGDRGPLTPAHIYEGRRRMDLVTDYSGMNRKLLL